MGGVGLSHKKRIWQPKARKCSLCRELKPIKDKISGATDPNKKECSRFGWEITNDLAAKTAVCRIEIGRKRRPHTPKRGGKKKK